MKQTRWIMIGLTAGVLVVAGHRAQAEEAIQVPPEKGWEGSAAVGVTVTSGNSDTLLATLTLGTKREWPHDVWALGASAAYGQNEGDKNNERVDGFVDYQHLFTERLYAGLHLAGEHDGIAAISYRLTIGPNLGYYFIKSEKTRLSGEIGPALVIEKIEEATDWPTHEHVTLRIADRFEHQLTAACKIWQLAEYLPQIDDFGNYVLNAEVGVEAAISKAFSLRLVLQDRYRSQPATGRKYNDLTFIGGLGYKF